jgi:hypothetical protein
MKFRTPAFLFLISILFTTYCIRFPNEPSVEAFYFNSFEIESDTTDWYGISYKMFVENPAPNGGDKALLLCGGCVQPAAYIDLPISNLDENYSLSFWAKIIEENQSGIISLSAVEGDEKLSEISLLVDSQNWKYYKSEKNLFCPAGKQVRLEIIIGGFIPASILVDLLKIEKQNK